MDIQKLKEEKNAVILAHNYQVPEIQDVADFVGDSLGLARKAQSIKADIVIMCGVDFMAETVAVLNPDKKVLFPEPEARCPMAHMLSVDEMKAAKEKYPEADVVLYINTTTECKALADCLCTSANSDTIVNKMESDVILFGPDRHLAYYVAVRTEKDVFALPETGYCPTHQGILLEDLKELKRLYQHAHVVVHPECILEVQDFADAIESTSGMLRLVGESELNEFIIGTEKGLVYRMEKENPGKKFYHPIAVCPNMKKINLENLAYCLENEKNQVIIPEETRLAALKPLERMLELSP